MAFGLLPLIVLITMFPAAEPVQAHSSRIGGSTTGIPIPSLSHGEMSVISAYDGEIVDLAMSALDTNEPFRRVLNFSQIEYTACMWGLMPGSITDENSPFNECSHAYLAAVKQVLLDMRTMPAEAKRATKLVSRIDEEMVLSGMALIGCQFSNETFNTADMIAPDWLAVPSHAPSAFASLGFLIVSIGGVWGGAKALRKHSIPATA